LSGGRFPEGRGNVKLLFLDPSSIMTPDLAVDEEATRVFLRKMIAT